ncbi:MAG TPA: hypothetical protein VK158_03755 [Acidobacteriota bacterium]|nr:hypothetical protein [Acidobacteriota bacterium]
MRPFPMYRSQIDDLMIQLHQKLLVFQSIDTKRTPFVLLYSQRKEIDDIARIFSVIDDWLQQNVIRNFYNDTRSELTLDAIGLSGSHYYIISKMFQNLAEHIQDPHYADPRHLYQLQLLVAPEFKTLFCYHYYIPTISHLLIDETTSIELLRLIMKSEPTYLATLITTSIRLKAKFGTSKQLLSFVANSIDFFGLIGDSVYTRKCIFENAFSFGDPIIWMRRLQFQKTGSKLIPLSGPLSGYLIRIVSKESFEAWKKAFENGLQVEPLVRDRRGRYRAKERKDGMVTVLTQYAGQNLMELDIKEQLDPFVIRQKQETINRLDNLGIIHGHCEDHNWCVKFVGKRPHLTLIDWDQATVHPTPLR